jgi:hypothetical protein
LKRSGHLLDKGFGFLCGLSVQVGEGDPELGAYRLSPVPSVWAPSRYGLPRIPIFWRVRFVVRFSCPRSQCEGAACQGRLEAKKAGGFEWWPSAPRLFCWKAYTLALTQSGVALHWHALKTAPPDAELGGQPGDLARVDGAEGLGWRDESTGRGDSWRGERLGPGRLWGVGVGGRDEAGPSRTLDPTGVKTNGGIHARPLLNDAMLRAAQPLPDQSVVIYLKES